VSDDAEIDREDAIRGLNAALRLQYRSPLVYAAAAGSLTGLETQHLAQSLASFAAAELHDARKLVEKIVALGGEPGGKVAAFEHVVDARAALEQLVALETEAVDAAVAVIRHTGHEGEGEALEHLLEHLILRKQGQLDLLRRALG